MRAGEPDAMDRMVGFAFGGLAIQLLQQGKSGRMVALRDGNYCHVPAATLLQSQKSVDVSALYDAQNYRAQLMRVEGMPISLYLGRHIRSESRSGGNECARKWRTRWQPVNSKKKK